MAKVTQQQLIDHLSRLTGESVELVENEADSEFDETAFISAIDKARTPIIKQLVSKDISGETSRKTHNAYRKVISELTGIPVTDIAELEPKDIVEKGLTHYKSTISDAGGQSKIDQILKAHAEEVEALKVGRISQVNELRTTLTRKNMIDVLAKYHRDAAGLPEKANREKLAENFLTVANGYGILRLNENGDDIEIYDKNDPNTALLNKSNTNKVGVMDVMKQHYSELGMWDEDTRDISATTAAKAAGTKIGNPMAEPSTAMPVGNPNAAYADFAKQFQ